MQQQRALLLAIKQCGGASDLQTGKQLHEQAIRTGLISDKYVANSLLTMYSKCSDLPLAQLVFDSIPCPDVVSRTALTSAYALNHRELTALHFFSLHLHEHLQKQQQGINPNPNPNHINPLTFVAAIKACTSLAAKQPVNATEWIMKRGLEIHRYACDQKFYVDLVANSLVSMYSKCGSLDHAMHVFQQMPAHGIVSWNAILLACSENHRPELALDLFFHRMIPSGLPPNARTLVSVLTACSLAADREEPDRGHVRVAGLRMVKFLHNMYVENGSCVDCFVTSALIDAYSRCGSVVDARRVFDRVPEHDPVSRNSLLFGYADCGESEVVLQLFLAFCGSGVRSARTILAPIKACTDLAAKEEHTVIRFGRMRKKLEAKVESLDRGMRIHSMVAAADCDSDVFLASSLIRFYSQCGSMVDARSVFDRAQQHNVVIWNSLLLGYVDNGEPELALELFERMICVPNEPSFLAVLKACGKLAEKEEHKSVDGRLLRVECLRRGAEVHSRIVTAGLESETFVANSLIDMYSQCGSVEDASKVFWGMSSRSVVSFNSLMLAFAENKQGDAALRLFFRMGAEGCEPNPLTFNAALKACSSVVAPEAEKIVEREIYRCGVETDELLQACLVDAHCKCGSVIEAQIVFDSLPKRDLVTRTALMVGYSRHGDAELVFRFFQDMIEERLRVDGVTFICIFTACSHVGLVDRGLEFFQVMSSRYGVEPDAEHYTCMVDLLGRANRLAEAESFVKTMPVSPSSVTWITLLGACQKWKNVDVGRFAFESLIRMDKCAAAPYVLMANIYGSVGMWKEQSEVLALKKSVSTEDLEGTRAELVD